MLLICPMIVLLPKIYSSWFESVPVFAEGLVEHQNPNQTATFQWPVGFVFDVQLDYSCRFKSFSSTAGKRVVFVGMVLTGSGSWEVSLCR